MTEVIDSIAALRARPHGPRLVVMTMGALHEGHLELVRAGRQWFAAQGLSPAECEVVVTVFVNPLQFPDATDLAAYPRTLDADVALCRNEGVDVVFAPSVEEMYPHGDPVVTIDPGPLGDDLEGAARPGHFRGMLTVVNRLLMLTGPAAAAFGEKDFQQLALIRQMVADLLIPVAIVGVPTVREPDLLAMSSRNRRLGAGRASAVAIPAALERLRTSLAAGAGIDVDAESASVARWLAAQPGVDSVDYLVVRSEGLGPAPSGGEARALVAAVVGGVRLLDNVRVTIGEAS
ncbi:MAG: pantoate--beta-alanine ligase [Actinobacteria bacterium]|uniref:pantoate--beta-alanine ligase (AMP-forming) n=1 Tax=freshwater metagenome TaxID=449393 RepID=A0A6J7RH86_9ZZZZ|nr:pantoate--beta-alanine ligase [Actinomycetota bacterium]MSW42780.1 pantoate--beta-alanine ligase [Actinomycetota bacterium]